MEQSSDLSLSEWYPRYFHEGGMEDKTLAAWHHIAGCLTTHFPQPEWCDVGCGPGALSLELAKRGKRAWGVEGTEEAVGLLPSPIVIWDLRHPLDVIAQVDVVTCFDVAEHVGAAQVLVDTLTALARCWVLFGAAPPGQDGHGHIDLRPHEEWQELFEKKGWVFCHSRTKEIRYELRALGERVNHLWWVEKNLQVFTPSSLLLQRLRDSGRCSGPLTTD